MVDATISTLLRVPASAAIAVIAAYRFAVSPILPIVCGAACGCRFAPTCSAYAAEALEVHGFWVGLVLAARRLAKCTPLHPGGLDPVPNRALRFRAERVNAASRG